MNSLPVESRVLGFDLGYTIYDVQNQRAFPDAYRVIRRLVTEEMVRPKNMHIVSRVTPDQEVRARRFVTSPEFECSSIIPLEQIHFCRERHEKAPICVKLGITEFMDDRPGVLMHMPPGLRRILFNPTVEDLREFGPVIQSMVIVYNWAEVEELYFPA